MTEDSPLFGEGVRPEVHEATGEPPSDPAAIYRIAHVDGEKHLVAGRQQTVCGIPMSDWEPYEDHDDHGFVSLDWATENDVHPGCVEAELHADG